ncbi:MFS transporter, metabolite:H+ symporter [Colletotrichum costaricense]|uniref:MFS transporter, metabolite:H+ symporter n=1 Tax=Colletotrichum costaricense TaxID=1209916 RepID=A0AAJ0DZV8_9PEZI|nr:MFS transporter, metabolite:H+ symporter [Colletotrichum costaricense]KAK1526996.1 MFS transporter, metabolite:H+ symporter [Colletotrichum costaricense]
MAPDKKDVEDKPPVEKTATGISHSKGEVEMISENVIDMRGIDSGVSEVYQRKVAVMNQALVDISMGSFQWKVFAMTGFGWFVDNFWMQAITIIGPPVRNEFQVKRIAFLTLAKYAGLVVGSSVWPMTADIIGRRLAFNITLLISSVSGLIGAGSPNFVALAIFTAFIGIGTGGNQPVDSAIFLEYIPATHQYLLTMQSAFWSVGQAVAALVAWPLIANYSCDPKSEAGCTYSNNLGWRYTYWTFGGITLTMFLLRFFFRVYETPKFLLSRGLDQQAVDTIQKIAARDGKTSWLTVSHFESIDAELNATPTETTAPDNTNKDIIKRSLHKLSLSKIRVLFSSPRMALSTTLMIFLWCSIGMAYPLYNSFIPIYLETKGVTSGAKSTNDVYRTYAIQAVCGIPASLLGSFTVDLKGIGRKGTGTIACLSTGVFLFLFTRATTQAGVLGFSCAIAFFQNLVYGLLYSYTPELFPAPVRGTANGLVALFNRLSGLIAPIIAAYVGIDNDYPVWVSAALFILAGLIFLVLPYETRGRAAA